jgi:hypothetical protein
LLALSAGSKMLALSRSEISLFLPSWEMLQGKHVLKHDKTSFLISTKGEIESLLPFYG